METKIIYRTSPDQFLTEILEENGFNGLIPSGYIIDKTEPGVGATQSEILDKTRNSIILEPFKAVIEVKQAKFKNLLGVCQGVKVKDITAYLKSDICPKKIMVTPESFEKVVTALSSYDPNFRENYFMLIDECEKLVQDCVFRKRILNPNEEFLKFTHKALISATPSQQILETFKDFKKLKVIPTYPYQKNLNLLVTNNIQFALRNLVIEHTDNKPYFIFTNCKKTIAYMTKMAGVKDDYSIFCAQDLDENFFQNQGIGDVKYSVVEQKYSRYNFFTSRFFSAVDMFLPDNIEKAHVLMISNLVEARHSAIDPSIDAIQIFGRIRRIKGVDKVATTTHLTNLNPIKAFENEAGVLDELEKEIALAKLLRDCAEKTLDPQIKVLIESLEERLFADKTFNDDGTPNEFYEANFKSKRSLMFQYTTGLNLLIRYKQVPFFTTTIHEVNEPFSDADRLSLKRANGPLKRQTIAMCLNHVMESYTGFNRYDDVNMGYHLETLEKMDPLTFKAFFALGIDHLFKVKFNAGQMKKDLFASKQNENNPLLMIDRIITTFPLNIPVYCDDAKSKLQDIYDEFDFQIKPGKEVVAKASDLEEYFQCVRRNGKKKVDGSYKSYYILYCTKFKLGEEMAGIVPEYHF